MIRTIAVLGAGHGGCAAAADLGRRGYSVRLHARNEERLAPLRKSGGILVSGIHDGLVPIDRLTTNVAEAIEGADLVMLVVPSVAHQYYAKELAGILDDRQTVLLNPGHTGGGLHFVHELRRANNNKPIMTCETVTLTYICRMAGEARVHIYKYTENLAFSAFPGRGLDRLHALIQPIYPQIRPASSVLETGLTNINAVFHPTGMLMNAGWIEHTHGEFLFYIEGITESVGRVTEAVDAERLAVAKALGVPSVPFVEAFYRAGLTTREARDSGSISAACKASAANRAIKSPPSLQHRYIMEDIGFGIVPIAALGQLAGVPTPTIDALIVLGSKAVGVDLAATGLNLEKMGLGGLKLKELQGFLESGNR